MILDQLPSQLLTYLVFYVSETAMLMSLGPVDQAYPAARAARFSGGRAGYGARLARADGRREW
jgi:hypothetical protein